MTGETIDADDAQALPMPTHHLHRDEDGRGHVTCSGPAGALCRLICDEYCGAESWPCGDPPHRMRDGGECNVVLFIEDGDDVDDSAVVIGDRDLIGYVGPITAKWDGDGYLWDAAP